MYFLFARHLRNRLLTVDRLQRDLMRTLLRVAIVFEVVTCLLVGTRIRLNRARRCRGERHASPPHPPAASFFTATAMITALAAITTHRTDGFKEGQSGFRIEGDDEVLKHLFTNEAELDQVRAEILRELAYG